MNNTVIDERIVCACTAFAEKHNESTNPSLSFDTLDELYAALSNDEAAGLDSTFPVVYSCSVRHSDRNSVELFMYYHNNEFDCYYVEGFMTNKGNFLDRKEAMRLAIEQNQIVRLVGNQTPDNLSEQDLYSENLY